MQAIALLAPGKIDVVERPEPDCRPSDVIIAMRAVGLCGSDLSVYSGAVTVPTYPWVVGHEGGGEVVAIGSDVTNVHIGQSVVIEPNICCLACPACRAGKTSACANRRALGITAPGIAAERLSVPAEFCWPISDSPLSTTLAGMEPHVVARTAARRAGVRSGDRCLIVGAGSQGLILCVYLLSIGVQPFVVEPHGGRLRLALRLGAQEHQSSYEGYSIVFESSGARAAFRTALDATAVGGRLVLIGQSHDEVSITTRELVQRQITILGSLIYDHPHDFADAMESSAANAPNLASVMQASYPPADASYAFQEARTIAGKSWLDLTSGWAR